MPQVTDEKFHSHWRNPHGELARRITTIRRYSQSHAVAASVSGFSPAPYLGLTEVYFDSVEIAAAMGSDPNYTNYCGANEPNFIDQSRLAFMFCSENVVLPGPDLAIDTPEIRGFRLLKRAPGLAPAEFRDRLESLAEVAVAATPELSRYVQCVTLPEVYARGESSINAIVELSWACRAAYERSWSSQSLASRHRPALAAITDMGATSALLAEPYRVIWPWLRVHTGYVFVVKDGRFPLAIGCSQAKMGLTVAFRPT